MPESQNPNKYFHVSINVGDLKKSVDFYSTLTGQPPTKNYDDYAKFELEDPKVVLSLEPGVAKTGGTLNHLGIRVAGSEEIRDYYQRLAVKGIEAQFLNGVQCCYSKQSKIVTRDPDGNLVEVYVLEEDLTVSSGQKVSETKSVPSQTARTFDHIVGTELVSPESSERDAYAEVNFRGTFNDGALDQRRSEILRDAIRVAAPGGVVTAHLLVGDGPIEGKIPQLPPPAQHVNHVPSSQSIVEDFERAGLCNVSIKRLSHSPVFNFGGVAMRELLISGTKPAKSESNESCTVVYKGPFAEIRDERGTTYPRGKQVTVDSEGWTALAPLAEHFVVLSQAPSCSA